MVCKSTVADCCLSHRLGHLAGGSLSYRCSNCLIAGLPWQLLSLIGRIESQSHMCLYAHRAAAAPFLGNFTVGSQNYKWLIFGDDDTVFLIDNVLKLVNEMDHKIPYFMTDHIWFPEREGEIHSPAIASPYHQGFACSDGPACNQITQQDGN